MAITRKQHDAGVPEHRREDRAVAQYVGRKAAVDAPLGPRAGRVIRKAGKGGQHVRQGNERQRDAEALRHIAGRVLVFAGHGGDALVAAVHPDADGKRVHQAAHGRFRRGEDGVEGVGLPVDEAEHDGHAEHEDNEHREKRADALNFHESHQVDNGETRHDEQLHAEGACIVQREQLRGVAADHGDVGAR